MSCRLYFENADDEDKSDIQTCAFDYCKSEKKPEEKKKKRKPQHNSTMEGYSFSGNNKSFKGE